MLADRIRMVGNGKKPPDEYTMALLHMNGTDGSIIFADEIGKIWTPYGNAQIDTAESKFGGASVYFGGVDDYLQTSLHTDFNIGSENCTIECWFKSISTGAMQRIFGSYHTIVVQLGSDNSISFVVNGTTKTSGIVIGAGVWHHCAVVKNVDVETLYLDGVSIASFTGRPTIDDCVYGYRVGGVGESSGYNFKGWIDEFRFSKGIARWTANFTPPTKEY